MNEIYTGAQSEKLQYRLDNVAKDGQDSKARNTAERDAAVAEGKNYLWESIKSEGQQFNDALMSRVKNPTAAVDEALASVSFLVAGGIFGSAARARAGAGKSRDYLASEEGMAVISKAGERAGVGFTMASEGFSNAVDAQAQILDMSFDELYETSPMFRRW